MNGNLALAIRTLASMLACGAALLGSAGPVPHQAVGPFQQEPGRTSEAKATEQGDELERLRAMLGRSGPDGKEERESAVARLLAMSRPEAHRLLQEQLLRHEDPDQLRATILDALYRQLLANQPDQFGGADSSARAQILTGYLGAVAPLWRQATGAPEEFDSDPLRAAARRAMQRVPPHELESAASVVIPTLDPVGRVDVLRCLADMQQVLFTKTIAAHLESSEPVVRDGAERALQLLTCSEQPIRTKAEFDAWYERFGGMRYVDLVERAARMGPRPLERMRAELARVRVDAARELVKAYVVRTPGVDWAVVQGITVSDEPAVLDACLTELQATLLASPVGEGNAAPRQAFCRALLDRFRAVPAGPEAKLQRRRALLLEVAAYLARPEETELANEIRGLLLTQLDGTSVETQVAALRGLRRYPSPQARAMLVARARQLLADAAGNKEQLQAILDTLASPAEPRWRAPAPQAADKADWLELVASCSRSEPELELRARALALARTPDPTEQRVPEAFGVLLALVKDPALDTKFRATVLIYLEAWRDDQGLAAQWVAALHALLEAPESELRLHAAESLARLPQSTDQRREDWYAESITRLRDRLLAEPDAGVLRALVDCIKEIGRQPQMPERAIGALRFVLGQVPADQQFRVEPLLQALAAIAVDKRADRGQWLAACTALLQNGKRQSLRLVLQSHAAIDLSKDVVAADAATAERARQAMRFVIEAATLKPPRTPWNSSEALQQEVRDVRTAFGALDREGVPASERLDQPRHRLLRLSVDLAAGKFVDVVQRANGWLANGGGGNGGATAVDDAHRDRLRLFAAEAQLGIGKPDLALAMLDGCSPEFAADPDALDLSTRLATALAETRSADALALAERTLRATPVEDPAFRARLLDWLRLKLRVDPGSRDAALEEANRHASLFQAPDCPTEQRDAFEALRAGR